ncbi:MAG: septation protein A [Gammaproteobacteria bacterium]|nr:MAG: septation protein A [Gammaproteobacteria bacterium]
MKLLYDILPVLLFFVAYKVAGIYVATGIAVAAAALQAGWSWYRTGRIERMQLLSLGLLVLLGGVTIAFRDESFIKIKPTAVNWLFAAVFLASQWFSDKPATQRLMGKVMRAPDAIWRRLNVAWAIFFLFAGALNLWVALNFSTDVWVNFKLFGLISLTLLFAVAQAFYLARHARPADENDTGSGAENTAPGSSPGPPEPG